MYLIVKLYFLIFFCTVRSLAKFLTIENLHCKTICSRISTVAVLNNDQQLTCSITNPVLPKEIPQTPWSTEEEKPAFRPISLQVGWYVYKHKKIALNITWLQKVSELETGYIEGYYLEIGLLKYDAKIKVSKFKRENNSPKNYIQFHFHCYGTTGKYIKPEEKIQVKLYSKPMHQSNSREQVLDESITIPTCFEDERLSRIRDRHIATKECKRKWKKKRQRKSQTTPVYTTKEETTFLVHPSESDYSVYYALVSVFGAIIIIIIFLLLVAYGNKTRRRAIKGNRKILMVADLDNNEELEFIHTVATRLRDEHQVEIKCNWENQIEIGEDLLSWYHKTIEEANVLVLIMSYKSFLEEMSLTEKEPSGTELRQALNYAKKKSLRSKIDIVFFLTGHISKIQLMRARYKTPYEVYSQMG